MLQQSTDNILKKEGSTSLESFIINCLESSAESPSSSSGMPNLLALSCVTVVQVNGEGSYKFVSTLSTREKACLRVISRGDVTSEQIRTQCPRILNTHSARDKLGDQKPENSWDQ
jgi:hypothetical protein